MSGDAVAATQRVARALSVASAASSLSPAAMTSPVSIPAYSPRPTPPTPTPPNSAHSSGTCALAPKVMSQQPLTALGDGSQPIAGIVTQKEWVIPPRPKPGRKPATDTPPTKRKAQNRAAQRAFRERRAARVNELEDKIKEIEAEHAAQQLELQQEIERLRAGNTELIEENAIWKAEVDKLRADAAEFVQLAKGYREAIEKLKLEKKRVATPELAQKVEQVASPPSEAELGPEGLGQEAGTPPSQLNPVVEVFPSNTRESARIKARRMATASKAFLTSAGITSTPNGSGGCMKDSSGACPCMADANTAVPKTQSSFWLSPTPYAPEVAIHPLPKRPTSPSTNPPDKRTRLNATLPTSSSVDELETDFTAMYASGRYTTVSTPSTSSVMMADPCGFCSDGTPCVCAEMAMMEEQKQQEQEQEMAEMMFERNTRLPPLQLCEIDEGFPSEMGGRMGLLHPPNGTKAAMLSQAARGGCAAGGGPGSCSLCQKDPLAMLFCQSVASRSGGDVDMKDTSSANARGCCGGGAARSGGCCKKAKAEPEACSEGEDSLTSKERLPPLLPPSNSIYIPCSAAYQTLARHKAFEQASMDDFPGLVRPLVVSEGNKDGEPCCPKVEVGSLRDVLKMLDRRFASGRDIM